jgi:hypothetical protein
MKFIGGPLNGMPLPEWVIEQRPFAVIARANTDDAPAAGDGWTGTKPVDHTYSRQRWRRGRDNFEFYAFNSLTDDEIDKLAKKAFP